MAAACAQPLTDRGTTGEGYAVAQYPPPGQGEPWAGLPTADGGPPPGGRISLVFEGAAGVDLTTPVAGLLADDWVETVPNERETTAIAFGYHAPSSCAPQAILLGIPPAVASQWSLDALEKIALEALELSKLRMVDPDALRELGHLLPALFLADNPDPAPATISTDLLSEARP
jgi:hypothetical protein